MRFFISGKKTNGFNNVLLVDDNRKVVNIFYDAVKGDLKEINKPTDIEGEVFGSYYAEFIDSDPYSVFDSINNNSDMTQIVTDIYEVAISDILKHLNHENKSCEPLNNFHYRRE